jgi:hypothetical protein
MIFLYLDKVLHPLFMYFLLILKALELLESYYMYFGAFVLCNHFNS